MKKGIGLALAFLLAAALPVLAQRGQHGQQSNQAVRHGQGQNQNKNQNLGRGSDQGQGHSRKIRPPKANQGRLPPAPMMEKARVQVGVERRGSGNGKVALYVDRDRWYGNDPPGSPRFRVARAYEHGRFGHAGPKYRYTVVRVDAGRRQLWLPGGFIFQVAPWEWSLSSNWCWNCGDDFVVYDDPNHAGWYLLYNSDNGLYVHATFMGR